MPSDVIVRTRRQPTEPVQEPGMIKPEDERATDIDVKVEPPFTEYQNIKHKPYTVEYFKLGPYWEDKLGGFKNEIEEIESYIKGQVANGQMDNSLEAVKEFYKKIEKISNTDKTERVVIKIAKMAAYIKFLRDTDHIKLNNYKYGHI